MNERGSIRAYARSRRARGLAGGADNAVRKALKSKRISQESDGSIDFAKADAAWQAGTSSMAPTAFTGKRLGSEPPAARHAPVDPERDENAYLSARTRLELAKAEREEIKLAEEKGELISVAEARKAYSLVGKMHSVARENLPTHVAPLLIGKSDLDEIESILRREMRSRDEQIANELESRHAELFADESANG